MCYFICITMRSLTTQIKASRGTFTCLGHIPRKENSHSVWSFLNQEPSQEVTDFFFSRQIFQFRNAGSSEGNAKVAVLSPCQNTLAIIYWLHNTKHFPSLLLGFTYLTFPLSNWDNPTSSKVTPHEHPQEHKKKKTKPHTHKKIPVIQCPLLFIQQGNLKQDSDALNQQDSVWHYGQKMEGRLGFQCVTVKLCDPKYFCCQEIHFKPSSSVQLIMLTFSAYMMAGVIYFSRKYVITAS